MTPRSLFFLSLLKNSLSISIRRVEWVDMRIAKVLILISHCVFFSFFCEILLMLKVGT